jgi:hypothetical protein
MMQTNKISMVFFLLLLVCCVGAQQAAVSRGYSIPLLDLAGETQRQVIVDREPGQYLGHPTTVLLEDKRTIITVYPKGHGKGAIMMKRSRMAERPGRNACRRPRVGRLRSKRRRYIAWWITVGRNG